MKKLTLAAAIALAATSTTVNAVTVLEKDGFKMKIDGDIQIQLRDKGGANDNTGVDFDDSEIKTKLSYDLGHGLTGFAESHFDQKKESSEETFVGLKSDNVKVILGNTNYATDEFGVEKATEMDDEDAFPEDEGDILRVDFSAGPASISVSRDFEDTVGANDSTDIYAAIT